MYEIEELYKGSTYQIAVLIISNHRGFDKFMRSCMKSCPKEWAGMDAIIHRVADYGETRDRIFEWVRTGRIVFEMKYPGLRVFGFKNPNNSKMLILTGGIRKPRPKVQTNHIDRVFDLYTRYKEATQPNNK